MPRRRRIVRRALRLEQNEKLPLYTFSLTGDELNAVADISRISRGKAGALLGYQRPEVKRHIRDIATYLDGDNVLFPNPIILALPTTTVFRASRGPGSRDGLATSGSIEIPLPGPSEPKLGWIVDGQQRTLALLRAKRRDFPVPVNAFLTDSLELQRDQFLRINNSKPLPRGLITELLPEIATDLPACMAARRIPSALCDLLNQDPESPFHGLIRRASTERGSRQQAVVADSSIVKMTETSISEPSGCLFAYRNIATGKTDFDSIRTLLFSYWGAVSEVFPDAWGRSPHESRLMHGAGIRAMGRLMDRVMSHIDPRDPSARRHARREIQRIAPACHWTSGRWKGVVDLRWDEIQNVPRHVSLLSNHLVRSYLNERSGPA